MSRQSRARELAESRKGQGINFFSGGYRNERPMPEGNDPRSRAIRNRMINREKSIFKCSRRLPAACCRRKIRS